MTRAVSVLAALLMATPALAQNPAFCGGLVSYGDHAEHVSGPVDLGGGIVAEYIENVAPDGDALPDAHERTRFEFCTTGRAITVWGQHLPAPGYPDSDPALLIKDAIASPEALTLDQIADRINIATRSTADVGEASSAESCGCAAFYPGARAAGDTP